MSRGKSASFPPLQVDQFFAGEPWSFLDRAEAFHFEVLFMTTALYAPRLTKREIE
jgi:hypothetical protein